jgi:hypothetical protein
LNRQDILVISEMEKGMTTIDIQSICDLMENVGVTVRSVHRFDCKVGKSPHGLILFILAGWLVGKIYMGELNPFTMYRNYKASREEKKREEF